jgi:hypothetical protein
MCLNRAKCVVVAVALLAATPGLLLGATPARVVIPDSMQLNLIVVQIAPEDRSEANIAYTDINGDRIDEAVVQVHGTIPPTGADIALNAIYELRDGAYVREWLWAVGERAEGLEFHDLDGDSVAELFMLGGAGNHYSCIGVVGWRDDEYDVLFENGTACFNFSVTSDEQGVLISIGREDWDNPDFCWATSSSLSLVEHWRWRDGAFRYDPATSTSPLITEREAVERSYAHMCKDGQPLNTGDKLLLHMWIAGTQVYKLFSMSEFLGE